MKRFLVVTLIAVIAVGTFSTAPAESVPTPGWISIHNGLAPIQGGGCGGNLTTVYKLLAADSARGIDYGIASNCSISVARLTPIEMHVLTTTGALVVRTSVPSDPSQFVEATLAYALGCPTAMSGSWDGGDALWEPQGGAEAWSGDCSAGYEQQWVYVPDPTLMEQLVAGGKASSTPYCRIHFYVHSFHMQDLESDCSWTDNTVSFDGATSIEIVNFLAPGDIITRYLPE